MSITLERVNPKTVLYEQVNDQSFANVIKGKIVSNVSTDKSSANWRTYISFADGSAVSVDEDRSHGIVHLRYSRSQAEQKRDGHL